MMISALDCVSSDSILHYSSPFHCCNVPSSPSHLQLFVAARSSVCAYLYDDVLPCLKFLAREMGVRVAVLTNGNANLTTCPVLGEYVTISLGE